MVYISEVFFNNQRLALVKPPHYLDTNVQHKQPRDDQQYLSAFHDLDIQEGNFKTRKRQPNEQEDVQELADLLKMINSDNIADLITSVTVDRAK